MRPHLRVARADLLDALRPVAGVRRQRGPFDAVMTFDSAAGMSRLAIGGTEVEVPAVGHWDGSVRAPAAFLVGLVSPRVLPPDDPVDLRLEEGRLRIGNLSTRGTWESPTAEETFALPLDATWLDVLRATLTTPTEALVAAGYARTSYHSAWLALAQLSDGTDRLRLVASGASSSRSTAALSPPGTRCP
jgi:hypothetical protein